MLNFFKQLCRRFYILLTFKGKIDSPVMIDYKLNNLNLLPTKDYIRESTWFTQANNLMDGSWIEPETSSSNFVGYQRYVWPIEVEYEGYKVLAENSEDSIEKFKKIDSGDTEGFYTIEEFNKKFTNIYKENVDVFVDDVYLMKNSIRRSDYNQDKTHRL